MVVTLNFDHVDIKFEQFQHLIFLIPNEFQLIVDAIDHDVLIESIGKNRAQFILSFFFFPIIPRYVYCSYDLFSISQICFFILPIDI